MSSEELWDVLGHETSVCDAQWPAYNEEYLKEDTINYTISFNGKARFNMEFAADEASDAIQAAVLADERSQKWMDGKTPKKDHCRSEKDCKRCCLKYQI